MARRYYLSKADRDKVARAVGGRSAAPRQAEKRVRFSSATSTQRFVKITSATQIGSYRWIYTGIEIKINSLGELGDGTPDVITLSNISNLYEAYNTENPGSAQGNGVVPNNLPPGFSIQPIRGFPVVEVLRSSPPEAAIEWHWICEPNAVDGTCAGG